MALIMNIEKENKDGYSKDVNRNRRFLSQVFDSSNCIFFLNLNLDMNLYDPNLV